MSGLTALKSRAFSTHVFFITVSEYVSGVAMENVILNPVENLHR